MTDIIEKCTICLVVIFQRGKIWVFGAYESEELAKKRVKEQDYLIEPEATIGYYNHTVWMEAKQ